MCGMLKGDQSSTSSEEAEYLSCGDVLFSFPRVRTPRKYIKAKSHITSNLHNAVDLLYMVSF